MSRSDVRTVQFESGTHRCDRNSARSFRSVVVCRVQNGVLSGRKSYVSRSRCRPSHSRWIRNVLRLDRRTRQLGFGTRPLGSKNTCCRVIGSRHSTAFSPDNSLIASGSEDQEVRVWNVATGDPVHLLIGHGHPMTSVALRFRRRPLPSV
jgi:WD40 repeat protein